MQFKTNELVALIVVSIMALLANYLNQRIIETFHK